MAVENQEKKYYKINFNKCKVEGYNVFVDYSIYDNQQERQKEKDREQPMFLFLNKLQNEIAAKQARLPQINNAGDPTIIEEDPELQKALDEISKLRRVLNNISGYWYKINGESGQKIAQDEAIMAALYQCGYVDEWVNDPICYSGGGLLNCGLYNDEVINHSFYYDRLKKMLSDAVLFDV